MAESTEQKSYGYGKRPLWQWIAIYVVLGVIIYGLIYYFVFSKKGNYNYGSTGQNQTPTQAQSTTNSKQITIQGSEYSFNPSAITVKKGEAIQITFKNSGNFPHNLTIADLNVQTKTIGSGQQDTVTFTPDKTGQFNFVCTVPGHADKGMTGTLIVQ